MQLRYHCVVAQKFGQEVERGFQKGSAEVAPESFGPNGRRRFQATMP